MRRKIFEWLLIVAFLSCITDANQQLDVEALVQKARALGEREPSAAVALLEETISSVEDEEGNSEDLAVLHAELGEILAQSGDLERAIVAFTRASSYPHPNRELTLYNTGFALQQSQRPLEALKMFKQAIEENPQFYEAYIKAAFILGQRGENLEVLSLLSTAAKIRPKEASTYLYMGDTLNNLKRWSEAVDAYRAAGRLRPGDWKIKMHLADTLSNLERHDQAFTEYEHVLKLSKKESRNGKAPADVVVGLLSSMLEICSWDKLDKVLARVIKDAEATVSPLTNVQILAHQKAGEKVNLGSPSALPPYATLFHPLDPGLQQRIAESWARKTIEQERKVTGWTHPIHKFKLEPTTQVEVKDSGRCGIDSDDEDTGCRSKEEIITTTVGKSQVENENNNNDVDVDVGENGSGDGRLRIGYISRRFEEYPGTQLMLRMFGLHDRTKFKVFTYASGPPDGSEERAIVQNTSDVFREIFTLSAQEGARVIAEDRVHVLVDYDGHHSFNNLALLAHRPAPLQITFLGFAGTTGASGVVDYIVSDRVITPTELLPYFSERVLWLPGTYQPQDHLRYKATLDIHPTRKEYNLPEDGIVYACFNRVNKIDPVVFEAWMEILRRVPTAVLWLYKGHPKAIENLKSLATKMGGESLSDRIIFGSRASKNAHLARLALADLMLDTLHYNAHTTTSDALWMGVPVLTRPGRTFASRVAASLVTSAGIPDMVVTSVEEYVERAVWLGSTEDGRRHLAETRATILRARELQARNFSFFDTPLFVRELEAAFQTLWKVRHTLPGLLPNPFPSND